MNPPLEAEAPSTSTDMLSQASSELNNLLQIISGASELLAEGAQEGDAAEHMAMLRTSIERAENLAASLARHAGGTIKKELMNPDIAGFIRDKSGLDSKAQKRTILLVDDEEMALTLVKRILSNAGFGVATTTSGFQCVDLVRKDPHLYDLVLLDLTMPFMDGEETFKRLREIRADLPVVLCTGFVQQERLTRLMTAGLAGFLRKPIAPDEIVSFVRSTLASIRYSRGGVDPHSVSLAI